MKGSLLVFALNVISFFIFSLLYSKCYCHISILLKRIHCPHEDFVCCMTLNQYPSEVYTMKNIIDKNLCTAKLISVSRFQKKCFFTLLPCMFNFWLTDDIFLQFPTVTVRNKWSNISESFIPLSDKWAIIFKSFYYSRWMNRPKSMGETNKTF